MRQAPRAGFASVLCPVSLLLFQALKLLSLLDELANVLLHEYLRSRPPQCPPMESHLNRMMYILYLPLKGKPVMVHGTYLDAH